MNRDFVLAASFAAAVHGALLFGFPKSPQAPVVPKEDKHVYPVDLMPPEDPPPVVETAVSDSGPKSPPEAPVIRSPEPPTVEVVSIFTMPKPEVQPFDRDAAINVIPTDVGPTGSKLGDGLSAVSFVNLDKSPRTRLQPSPIYPHAAKAAGLHGEVVVEFMVDESGRVHDARVVSSSDRVFEENALRAVAKWVFEPGRRNNEVVRFRMSVPIVFKLND